MTSFFLDLYGSRVHDLVIHKSLTYPRVPIRNLPLFIVYYIVFLKTI